MRLTMNDKTNTIIERQWQSLEYRLHLPKREKLWKPINKIKRKRLKNTDFSLIASNCNGAFISHDLGLKFRSPFVNLWMKPKDFITLLSDLKHYMEIPLKFTLEEGIDYPIGILDDVKVYFQHYKTEDEALKKWGERKKRINYDNIFILFKENGRCTKDDLISFDKLPFENKIVFTHKRYPEINSSFYIRGFEDNGKVGDCFMYMPEKPYMKYYDQFDYVKWFNSGIRK